MPVTKHIADKIEKYKAFYRSQKGGLMTITTSSWPEEGYCSIPINQVDWLDEKSISIFAKSILKQFKDRYSCLFKRFDDSIPTMQVFAGTGMVAAAFVKNPLLQHEKETNYLQQPICNWDDGIDTIQFDPNNQYYKAQMVILRNFIDEWDGNFAILPFTYFGPLDLVNQLRGNDVFYDFFEEEDNLYRLLEKCTNAILELEDFTQKNYMKGYDMEGTGMWCWLPGGGYLSCDIGDLCSADIIQKFDRPYFDKILSKWGGAFLHHHELGAHQIDLWAESKNLTIQFLNRDPNTKHLADIINDKIIETTFRVPIYFISTYEEFISNSHKWAQGKFVVEVHCKNEEEAKDVIRRTEKLINF